MSLPIVVVGHKNPDNDAICSAVGYAYLKNELARRDGDADAPTYVPARLGPLPPETAWVLEKNEIESPEVIAHVYARISDVMTTDPISISHDATLLEAGRLLRKHGIRSLVVTNDDGTYRGVISTREVANRYICATDVLAEDGSNEEAVADDLIESLSQRVEDLVETDVMMLDADDLLKEAAEDLLDRSLREGIVLDEDGRAAGIVTRTDVAVWPRHQVILVDHNEMRQAVNGIEDADVVEIIDHHRIADLSTANPIKFINMPVGSSSTIVAMEFQRAGVEIPASIASVLLSAIMTDTVMLKSPTATDDDREISEQLGEIAGVDPIEFGLEVFRTRGGEADMLVGELVEADSKEFPMGDSVVLVAQHETVDLPTVMEREQEIREHMRKLVDEHGYEFALLMVTDIMAEGSQFIVEGNQRLVGRIFDIDCTGEGGTWMPGVLSRKKQVASKILD